MYKTLAVLGAGSWGTALAIQAARSGNEVLIWSRSPEVAGSINNDHQNFEHLSEVVLPDNITASADITEAIKYKHILLAIPAQSVRQVLQRLPQGNYSFIIACKGVEQNSLKLMSEVVRELLPNSYISVLSGPNFAREVAQGLPSVTNIASQHQDILDYLIKIFDSPNFKVHSSNDVIGTQICGAAKNVIAIACGICLGSSMGENAKAAIITQGISEIGQLVCALGGKYETILTPAGIGDLTLTCGSDTSRNMVCGINLAKGRLSSDKLAEGSYAAQSISHLAQKHGLELKLIEAVARTIDTPTLAAIEIRKLFS